MITLTKAEPIGHHKAMCHLAVINGPHRWEERMVGEYDETRSKPLLRARLWAGLSIREACALVGMGPADYSGLERGRNVCSDEDWRSVWLTLFGSAPLTMADLCPACDGAGRREVPSPRVERRFYMAECVGCGGAGRAAVVPS